MKKLYIILFAFLLVVNQALIAGPVDETTARQTALRFMNNKVSHTRGTLSATQFTRVNTEFSHLYVYNLQGGGFVIVSDDDRTMPVLAYSTEGFVDANDMVPAVVNQLQKYNVQLQSIAEGGEVVPYVPRRNNRSVAPLVQTQWNQWSVDGTRYNSKLPIDSTLPNEGYRPTVGCVALAAAQVMKYWNWPAHGNGSNSYTYNYSCWHYGTISETFDSTYYDWNNMPVRLVDTSTQAQKDAVGTLLYHCGVAMSMEYNSDCDGSSSSTTSKQYFALRNHFSYSSDAFVFKRADYADSVWIAMLKNDLDANRPILYDGQSFYDPTVGTVSTGHAFLFDGYDENDLFHVNWGWGGYLDGYFNVASLYPDYDVNFSHLESAVLNLHPDYQLNSPLIPVLCSDMVRDTVTIQLGDNVDGHVDIYNPGDTEISFFAAEAIVENLSQEFVRWADVQHLTISAHDTLHYSFNAPANVPVGSYYTYMYYSQDSIDINAPSTIGTMVFPTTKSTDVDFWVTDTNRSSLSNLVIFIRFADDEEITYPFSSIDSMFNEKSADYQSVYNYFDALTYGKIHYNTIYPNQMRGNSIISFVDSHPRGYYQPYSTSNPIGYHGENPKVGISMREAQLLAAAMDYVDSLHLVHICATLDGDGDGYIDNVSFIVKGTCGEWSSILWPHMEFFPQDSIDHEVTINGKRPKTFNFELEGGGASMFNALVSRHEMLHSLGVPDMYHYNYFTNVKIADRWDAMANSYYWNHTCMMNKIKYLHIANEPIQITEDGTYTLYSNATSDVQSCYYIKSAIDSTQWFTFEYRNQNDPFEEGISGTGLIAGRWNNNVPVDIYANIFFDNDSILHQYWIFRPDCTSDTVNGIISDAHFSFATGRTSFGPTTNPYPYLADATPETSFEITDIQEQGDYLTFHVHFFGTAVEENVLNNGIALYPNPAEDFITLTGENMKQVEIYNAIGQLVLSETVTYTNHCTLSIANLAPGMHLARIIGTDGATSVVKFVKR